MAGSSSVTNANQFIGSRISLISRSEIRYEGILFSLDLQDATISLAKVRSFGTEDRPCDRPVPLKEDVFDFIIFRGSDIKSIDVLEPPRSGATLPGGLPADPAIVEVSHSRSHPDHGRLRYSLANRGEGVLEGLLRGAPRAPRAQGQGGGGRGRNNGGNVARNNGFDNGRRSREDNGGYRGGQNGARGGRGSPNRNSSRGGSDRDRRAATGGQGGGGGGGRNRSRSAPRQRGIIQAQQPPKVTFEDPFDFEKANEELKTAMEKLKIEDEKKGESPEEEGVVKEEPRKEEPLIYYDKDKFFDNISCEALENTKGQGRQDWRAERKLNAETFGVAYSGRRNFRFRNGGGRNNGFRPNNGGGGNGGNGGRFNSSFGSYSQNRGWNRYGGNRGQQQRT